MRKPISVLIIIISCLATVTAQQQQNLDKDPAKSFRENPTGSWKAIESNPGLLTKPEVLDAAFKNSPMKASSMINKKPSLLDDRNVAARFDKEAIKNPNVLNTNPEAKKKWFYNYGILDEGTNVKSYNGWEIALQGQNGEQGAKIADIAFFRLTNSRASATQKGELVIWQDKPDCDVEEKALAITKGTVSIDKSNSILVKDGSTSIYALKTDVKMVADGGTVSDGSYIYTSNFPISVFKQNSEIHISGTNVDGYKLASPNKMEKALVFSGEIVKFQDSSSANPVIILKSNTEFTAYEKNQRLAGYKVTKDSYLLTGDVSPTLEKNFIYQQKMPDGRIQIITNAKGGNKIDITNYGPQIAALYVHPIKDKSTVSFNDNNKAAYYFSDKPMRYSGNPFQATTDIKTTIQAGKAEYVQYIVHKNGGTQINYCIAGECDKAIARVAYSSEPTGKDGIKVVAFSADSTKVQDFSLAGLKKMPNSNFEGYLAMDSSAVSLKEAHILVMTGHHYAGEYNVWGKAGSIDISKLQPSNNVEIIAFSSCHTTMNPDNSKAKMQELVGVINAKYPNLKAIVGYDTGAPLDDTQLWGQLTKEMVTTVKNQKYETFADKALTIGYDNLNYLKNGQRVRGVGIEKESNGKWVTDSQDYSYISKTEGTRLGVYIKKNGNWVFYSIKHLPENSALARKGDTDGGVRLKPAKLLAKN